MNSYYAPTIGDPFNTLGLRNVSNTTKRYYNCGGYALGTLVGTGRVAPKKNMMKSWSTPKLRIGIMR